MVNAQGEGNMFDRGKMGDQSSQPPTSYFFIVTILLIHSTVFLSDGTSK